MNPTLKQTQSKPSFQSQKEEKTVASGAVTVQLVPVIKQSYTALISWILEETTKKYALSVRGKVNKIEAKGGVQRFLRKGVWKKQGRKGFGREGQAAREGQGWNNPAMGRARNRAGKCPEKTSKSYKKFFCKQRSVMWFLLHWNKSAEGHELDLHLTDWHWQLF